MPAYPLFAVVIALALAQAAEWIQSAWPAVNSRLAAAALGTVLAIHPLLQARGPVEGHGVDALEKTPFYNISMFLRRAADSGPNLDETVYLTDSRYDLQRQLYLRELKERRNVDMHYRHLSKWLTFKPGQKIMVHEPAPRKFINTNYDCKVVVQENNVLVCEVLGRKSR